MNIKNFALVILVLALFGCEERKNTSERRKILGKWTMCKIYSGKIANSFNICPIVSFNDQEKGVLHTGIVSEFSWELSNNILNLRFEKKLEDNDIMFGLSECTVSMKHDKSSEFLELKNIRSGNIYVLRRLK